MMGVGDFAPEEDVLGIFVAYGQKKGSVETHSDQWANFSGQQNNFTSRGGRGFRAVLGHIEQGLVDHLWGHESVTHRIPVGEG